MARKKKTVYEEVQDGSTPLGTTARAGVAGAAGVGAVKAYGSNLGKAVRSDLGKSETFNNATKFVRRQKNRFVRNTETGKALRKYATGFRRTKRKYTNKAIKGAQNILGKKDFASASKFVGRNKGLIKGGLVGLGAYGLYRGYKKLRGNDD